MSNIHVTLNVTEDELVGWHHRLSGREFEQTPGDKEQESLACCSPRGLREWDRTEQLNITTTNPGLTESQSAVQHNLRNSCIIIVLKHFFEADKSFI